MITLRIIVVIAALSTLSGCALKKHFPNKEKDYQFRKEIPTLAIPEDLKLPKFQPKALVIKENKPEIAKVIETTTVKTNNAETTKTDAITPKISEKATVTESTIKAPITPAKIAVEDTGREEVMVMVDMVEGPAAKPAQTSNLENYSFDEPKAIKPEPDLAPPTENITEPEIKPETSEKPAETEELRHVDFIMFDAGATRLRTNEKFTPIWRLVGKSLSHNQIEITQRDKTSGQFIVQYDPDRSAYKDEGVADEFWFVFSDKNVNENEFRIPVISHNKNIEILV